ncbi:MAG: hypothetical protein QXU67_02220 [Candidatus Bathyarchaeia archaeon]
MKSLKMKILVGAVLILTQALVVTHAYDLDKIFNVGISDFNEPVLLLFPLILTIIFASVSRNVLSSFIFGLSCWLIFPLVFFLIRRTQPSEAMLLILLAMGIFYGIVGVVSSIKMSEIKRMEVQR